MPKHNRSHWAYFGVKLHKYSKTPPKLWSKCSQSYGVHFAFSLTLPKHIWHDNGRVNAMRELEFVPVSAIAWVVSRDCFPLK